MRQADYLARRVETLGEMGDEGRARRNSVCGQCATAGEEDVSNTAIGTELSARIVDPFSAEVVNAADYGCAAAPDAAAQPDPPERAMGRRWLAVAATALMTAYVALVVVPAAETSPAPIAGIAPSYGPKTVSAVPNAPAIVRRIWLPELDAGYDPQGSRSMVAAFTSPPTPCYGGPRVRIRLPPAASLLRTGGLLEGRARNRIRSANTRCSFWSEIQLLAESGRAGQRPRS